MARSTVTRCSSSVRLLLMDTRTSETGTCCEAPEAITRSKVPILRMWRNRTSMSIRRVGHRLRGTSLRGLSSIPEILPAVEGQKPLMAMSKTPFSGRSISRTTLRTGMISLHVMVEWTLTVPRWCLGRFAKMGGGCRFRPRQHGLCNPYSPISVSHGYHLAHL